jgi:hypothetical protein
MVETSSEAAGPTRSMLRGTCHSRVGAYLAEALREGEPWADIMLREIPPSRKCRDSDSGAALRKTSKIAMAKMACQTKRAFRNVAKTPHFTISRVVG